MRIVRPASPRPVKKAACDFCRRPRVSEERHRLVWASTPSNELVLAELCGPCAARSDQLIEMYGGHGRNAISLMQPLGVPRSTVPAHRAFGFVGRGLLYLLIALAFFVVVTLITSRAR
jgi:hypothetical protein